LLLCFLYTPFRCNIERVRVFHFVCPGFCRQVARACAAPGNVDHTPLVAAAPASSALAAVAGEGRSRDGDWRGLRGVWVARPGGRDAGATSKGRAAVNHTQPQRANALAHKHKNRQARPLRFVKLSRWGCCCCICCICKCCCNCDCPKVRSFSRESVGVLNASLLAATRGAVSLEPCCDFKRQTPCAVAAVFQRAGVVVGMHGAGQWLNGIVGAHVSNFIVDASFGVSRAARGGQISGVP
jgi:hypothetical protein